MRPRPIDHLDAVSRDYPGVWRRYDSFLARCAEFDWPAWCHCPLSVTRSILETGGATDETEVARVGALAAWRPTQGIYRFDPTLLEQLLDTPVTGDIPTEHLLRMPEWCIYVETPGNQYHHGFFAHLDDAETTELRLLVDWAEFDDSTGSGASLVPFILPLVGTVEDSIRSIESNARERGMPNVAEADRRELADFLSSLVSVLLYLCSDEPEILPTRGRGAIRPTIRNGKMPPAKSLEVWETGFLLGAMLRDAMSRDVAGDGTVRAHVRRAHWHSYWRGEGRSERIVKWLSPILVGGGPDKPTARNVR